MDSQVKYGFVHESNMDKIDFNLLYTEKNTARRIHDYYIVKWNIKQLSETGKFDFQSSVGRHLSNITQVQYNHKEILNSINDNGFDNILKRMSRYERIEKILES